VSQTGSKERCTSDVPTNPRKREKIYPRETLGQGSLAGVVFEKGGHRGIARSNNNRYD